MAHPQKTTDSTNSLTNTFNLHTMRGRSFTLVLTSLVSLSIILVIAISYSNNTLGTKNQLLTVDLPMLSNTNGIWSRLNEAMSAHNGFLLTKNAKYKQEWSAAWIEVDAHFVGMESVYAQLPSEKQRQIDLLEKQLGKLRQEQQSLVDYAEQQQQLINRLPEEEVYSAYQSLSSYVERTISSDISPLMRSIRTELDILDRSLVLVEKDIEQIEQGTASHKNLLVFIVIFASVISLGFGYYIIKELEKSIDRPTKLINALAAGQMPADVPSTKDELDSTIAAGNQLKHNLAKASDFALSIGEGNFDTNFEPAGPNDQLGNALLQMRNRLQEVAEKDKKQSWITEGLAKFGDILRSDSAGFTDLSDKIISNLVKHLQASQGGIFILDEQQSNGKEKILQLQGAYAYGRKKFLERQVLITEEHAEGLVGQAFLEKQTILLADLPENYTHILSAVGSAKPKALVLVPLKMNNTIVGVLEIASFHQFEDYHVSFLEKVAENIASTVSAMKTNERTKYLLEDSQLQSEQMRAQEEEMRQNMEELAATQEEMSRKQNQLENLKASLEQEVEDRTKELSNTLERFDLASKGATEGIWDAKIPEDGNLLPDTPVWWSDKFKDMLGYTPEEFNDVFGAFADVIHPDDLERILKKFFVSLKDPNTHAFDDEMRLQCKSGDYIWVRAKGSILRDKTQKATRFAGVIINISDQKRLIAQQEALAEKEKTLRLVTSYSPGVLYQYYFNPNTFDHKFIFVSEGSKRLFGLAPESMIGRSSMSGDVFEVHKEDEEMQQQKLMESAKNISPYIWEGRMRPMEGENTDFKYIRIDSTPRQQSDGTLVWDGIMTDIAERITKDKEVESLKKKLASISANGGENTGEHQSHVDTHPDLETSLNAYPAIFIKMWGDESRLIEHISGQVEAITGYTQTEFEKQKVSFSNLMPKESGQALSQLNEQLHKALEKDKSFTLRYKIQRKDGASRLVMEKGRGVTNEEGQITHTESLLVDITDIRPNA